jgi:hypothetical protein
MPQQHEPARHLWIIRIAAGIGIVAVLVSADLIRSDARAADLPCPTQRNACWQVRLAVDHFGEHAMVERVRACGWSEARIAEARKCLAK